MTKRTQSERVGFHIPDNTQVAIEMLVQACERWQVLFTTSGRDVVDAIRGLPLAPDTIDGERQKHIRENAARLVEGRPTVAWEDLGNPAMFVQPRVPVPVAPDRLAYVEAGLDALETRQQRAEVVGQASTRYLRELEERIAKLERHEAIQR